MKAASVGLKPLIISGREVLPLVEGGKGISISNGESSGAWAAAGGVGEGLPSVGKDLSKPSGPSAPISAAVGNSTLSHASTGDALTRATAPVPRLAISGPPAV